MDDLSAALSQIMSNPESMQQIQNMAASLGLGGGSNATSNTSSAQAPASNTPDLSAIASLLGNLSGGGGNPEPANTPPAPSPPSGGGGGLDLSALAAALGGGQPQQQAPAPSGFPPIDMGVLLKLQQAFTMMNSNNPNVDLLRALKPHLKGERSKKVDDAIRIMQLIQLLPLIKESGLLGSLGNLFGGDSQ